MSIPTLIALQILAAAVSAPPPPPPDEARRWWAHVEALASDEMLGRETGTAEHRKAAEYVAAQFRAAGLQPAGTDGFFQPVAFKVRRYIEAESRLELVRGITHEPVALGEEAVFGMRIDPVPQVEAPLVFVGYGLTIPETGHDDLAGVDLRGKAALYFGGGPKDTPGPLLAHYQSRKERWEALQRAGAIGAVAIRNPHREDIPWERSSLARFKPAMELTDPDLVDAPGQQLAVAFNTEAAARLFAGTGRDFQELLAAAIEGRPLPHFALPTAARAKVAFEADRRESDNVVALLPGSDPALSKEYVVLSAHLDHLGVGEPIGGDAVYNGAMDNASGIATLIETARLLAGAKPRPAPVDRLPGRHRGREGPARLPPLRGAPDGAEGRDRGRRERRHVLAAVPSEERDRASLGIPKPFCGPTTSPACLPARHHDRAPGRPKSSASAGA